ncbi:bifunctional phosphopantothenoylcysteine decarboxylase/phosphopantothenate--cysteine ligase CoaBC [Peptococcaceae bacterium 1198_IL3148]
MLTGKKITLGIAGGIAVYKVAELVSGLIKKGAVVKVIMTEGAQKFVQPLTFSALTGHDVYTDTFNSPRSGGVTHIELAQRADLFVVVPATANIIGKVASGIADDLLSTVLLAADCPVIICPAMNTVMYKNPVVQQNIAKLQQLGYHFIGPNCGRLACGTEGPGRMSEPGEILKYIAGFFQPGDLQGVNILVSAGPTREPVDPVRFITNRSSGKMGYSIAKVALQRGANVTLVSGPVNLSPPAGVELIKVETAQQMHTAMLERYDAAEVVIKSAAVADYRPLQVADKKIKKTADDLTLSMVKNPDILAELGQLKKHQILVGFAAETNDLDTYAREKLHKKNLDLLVANNVASPGAGFDVDTNVVSLYYRHQQVEHLPLMDKQQVAQRILDGVVALLAARRDGKG